MGLLQIAILGTNPDAVPLGVREVGADRVAVVGRAEVRASFEAITEALAPLKVETEFHEIEGEPLLGIIRAVQDIADDARKRRMDVVLNIGGADRTLTCAGLSSGFVAGVTTFDVIDGRIVHLPVLRFSYDEIVNGDMVAVLRGLQGLGGQVDDLHELAGAAGVDASMVSYHIRGGREGPGLEELGLVEVVRREGGALRIALTPMGDTLASGMPA